jgi:hypothetical protein
MNIQNNVTNLYLDYPATDFTRRCVEFVEKINPQLIKNMDDVDKVLHMIQNEQDELLYKILHGTNLKEKSCGYSLLADCTRRLRNKLDTKTQGPLIEEIEYAAQGFIEDKKACDS